MVSMRCLQSPSDGSGGSPLWEAGDLHRGRSLPPGGKWLFEINVDGVGKHHQAIVHLQDKSEGLEKVSQKRY